jgi:hypothetical protein
LTPGIIGNGLDRYREFTHCYRSIRATPQGPSP